MPKAHAVLIYNLVDPCSDRNVVPYPNNTLIVNNPIDLCIQFIFNWHSSQNCVKLNRKQLTKKDVKSIIAILKLTQMNM